MGPAPPGGQGKASRFDGAAHAPSVQTDGKHEATVIARLAIHAGQTVHRLIGGEYLVTWRNCTKHCRDLADLEAHAQRVRAMR